MTLGPLKALPNAIRCSIGIILIYFAQTVDAMIQWPGSQELDYTVESSMLLKDHELTTISRGLSSRTEQKTRHSKSWENIPALSKRFASAMSMVSTDEGYLTL